MEIISSRSEARFKEQTQLQPTQRNNQLQFPTKVMAAITSAGNASASKPKPEKLPVTVDKPTPYTFDLGNLLALDPNPLPLPLSADKSTLNTTLTTTARDGAQSLINQLLTTCPISTEKEGVLLTLPPPTTTTPRHKPLPVPKQPTKWELFARKKGVGKYNTTLGSKGGASMTENKKKMVYDEEKGDWVPRWGYKGKNKGGEDDWLVEVDDKKWKKEEALSREGKSIRGEGRRERMEKVRRNERKMRANERAAKKGGSR